MNTKIQLRKVRRAGFGAPTSPARRISSQAESPVQLVSEDYSKVKQSAVGFTAAHANA